jgi:hypothetical protein
LPFKKEAVFPDMTIMVARFAAKIGTALHADMAVGQAFATDSIRSRPDHIRVG